MKKVAIAVLGLFFAIAAFYYDFHTSQSINCLDALAIPGNDCRPSNIKYIGLIAGLVVSLLTAKFIAKINGKSYYFILLGLFAGLLITFLAVTYNLSKI